jgi:hypothetical protein
MRSEKMSNGTEKIDKYWKKKVLKIFREHPDWNATEVREQLLEWIGEARTVGKSAVQKELQRLREIYGDEINSLEALWHTGTLENFPIPADAIPDILRVQSWGSNIADPPRTLTIGQAIWISRIRGVANNVLEPAISQQEKPRNQKDFDKIFDMVSKWLWEWSDAYAQWDIICKLDGTELPPYDMSELDAAMWKGAYPVSRSKGIVLSYPGNIIDVLTKDSKFLEEILKNGEQA